MEVYSPAEARLNMDDIIRKILAGKLFIHPTDTIYGIGCNALDDDAVLNLRNTKRQLTRPFSIMVPDIAWIRKNCMINSVVEDWLEKLPGKYTLILDLRNNAAIAKSVNFGSGSIGVRLPDHWFVEFLKKAGTPIITTSANITGENFMTCREGLEPLIEMHCSFMIDQGPINGTPSTIVDLTAEDVSVTKRK